MLHVGQLVQGEKYRDLDTGEVCVVLQTVPGAAKIGYENGLLWWTNREITPLEELTPLEKELL
jgi:hypothetical protein